MSGQVCRTIALKTHPYLAYLWDNGLITLWDLQENWEHDAHWHLASTSARCTHVGMQAHISQAFSATMCTTKAKTQCSHSSANWQFAGGHITMLLSRAPLKC